MIQNKRDERVLI